MLYGDDPRALAEALDGEPSVDVALFLEDGEVVARRDGDEDLALLDEYPGRPRARRGARCATRTRARCSSRPRPGWEFADLGGPPPPRRRQPRLARAERLRGADADRRPRRAAGVDHRDQGARCSSTSASPVAQRRLERGAPAGSTGSSARRGIHDERVLAAMARVPARALRPARAARATPTTTARSRSPLGQTISQPYMVALTCQALALEGGERVLDVGTGSGYAAAVLAELAAEVHSIERIPELAERRARGARGGGLRARPACTSATARSACPSWRRTTAIAVAAAARRGAAGALGAAADGRPHRAAARTGRRQQPCACSSGPPAGPRLLASIAGAVRPARLRSRNIDCAGMPLLASIGDVAVLENRAVQALRRPATGSSSRSSASSARAATSSTSRSTRCSSRAPASTTSARRRSRSSSRRARTTGGTATGRSASSAGHFGYQGMRFFVVSGARLLRQPRRPRRSSSRSGWGRSSRRQWRSSLVTPLNFLGNKLWSFRR